MHRIATPRNHVVIETAELAARPDDDLDDVRRFVVRWNNVAGQRRWCGVASGGLSAQATCRLLDVLFRSGVVVVNIESVA